MLFRNGNFNQGNILWAVSNGSVMTADVLPDAFCTRADEKEVAFDRSHSALAEIEIVDADFAKCHVCLVSGER